MWLPATNLSPRLSGEGENSLGFMEAEAKSIKKKSAVGSRLAEARRRAGLTQVEMAEKLGVTQQVITFWEREAPAPRAEMLPKIAVLLNISIDELLGISKEGVKKGPVSRLERQFNEVGKLPKRQQEKILGVVDALLKK
jgi:transcriptional regulator with XRE-family HTH domain